MKQIQARVLQEIVNETYREFEEQFQDEDGYNQNGTYRWMMPISVHVTMRKSSCIYCDNTILLGQFKTTHGAHLDCWEARLVDSQRLIQNIKNKFTERGLELEMPEVNNG